MHAGAEAEHKTATPARAAQHAQSSRDQRHETELSGCGTAIVASGRRAIYRAPRLLVTGGAGQYLCGHRELVNGWPQIPRVNAGYRADPDALGLVGCHRVAG